SKDANTAHRRDRSVDPIRIARRDGDVGLHESVSAVRAGQPVRQLLPRRPAVRRLEDAAVRAVPRPVFPGALARLPQAGVHDVRIFRIELDVRRAGVLVLEQPLLKGAPAVGRSEDAALVARSIWVAERRDEHAVRIAWVDDDVRDLLGVAEAEMAPR